MTEQKKLVGEHHYRKELEWRPGHITHHACNEIIERFGGQSYGCCCTGHVCEELKEKEHDI